MSTQAWREVPRQDGRRFVVTGASGGIGLETAKALAGRGAHVVLAVRNLDRGRAAAAHMDGDVELGLLDVADLASVRAFAEGVGPVDVLINNAGALALPLETSPDGVELHLATNHLGHFALTNLLLPRLTDRVVVVGSPSHRHGHLDLEDLGWRKRRYRPYSAYADSKLANLLFMAELQRRLTAAGSTLRVTGAHPGSTATGITGSTGSRLKTFVGKHGHQAGRDAVLEGRAPDAVRRHDGRTRQHLRRPAPAPRDERLADRRGPQPAGARPRAGQGPLDRVGAVERGHLPAVGPRRSAVE